MIESRNHFTIGDASQVNGPEVNCWIFDPPYNIGYKYGAVRDDLEWSEYEALIRESVKNMAKHTKEGHLWMINYAVQSARLLEVIEAEGWVLHQWLTWTYPTNVGHSESRFTKASRAILWFTKGTPYFDVRATIQPYKNPNDRRIKQKMAEGNMGTAHYDHWMINLRKNDSKGYRSWFNQLPIDLVSRIIQTCTQKGDVVGDLMAGSGTTLEVAGPLLRGVWLNDLDENAMEHWQTLESDFNQKNIPEHLLELHSTTYPDLWYFDHTLVTK